MSRIPDCRADEAYNEKYLNEIDSECITGYDFSIEDNINNFFNNISNWENDIAYALGLSEEESVNIDEEILDSDKDIEDYDESEFKEMGVVTALLITLKQRMLEWAENNRDEMITSMIENMKDSEYDELKAKADTGEYKNAILRQREYRAKYEAGEVPTCWTFEKDENGNPIKIGHCPNGTKVIESNL